uniref:Uncharacterized protein n=1 Tax=Anguilla anguilla TaxID=7936 RepID=A0A0E9XFS3_ANGAN
MNCPLCLRNAGHSSLYSFYM